MLLYEFLFVRGGASLGRNRPGPALRGTNAAFHGTGSHVAAIAHAWQTGCCFQWLFVRRRCAYKFVQRRKSVRKCPRPRVYGVRSSCLCTELSCSSLEITLGREGMRYQRLMTRSNLKRYLPTPQELLLLTAFWLVLGFWLGFERTAYARAMPFPALHHHITHVLFVWPRGCLVLPHPSARRRWYHRKTILLPVY